MSIFQACIPSTIMSLLICLLAVLSVAIASPVPDAESNFPSPLKGIADFNFGSYPPPPQDVGGIIASQGASVLGDNQDLSTGWDNLAPIPQSDTSAHPMLDSNGNLIVQSYSQERKYGSQNSNTRTTFQDYLRAECGGTKSVCCSGTDIDADEPPGVPLPCSDSMHSFFVFFFSTKSKKDLFATKENSKMVDAGYEPYLWAADTRLDRYCRRPVFLTDCNTVLVCLSFLLFPSSLFFRKLLIIIISTTVNSDLPY